MQHINGAYTTYFSINRERSGHLFQGRYKAILVKADAYAKELSRYIHLNPVKALMVKTPEEYKWSSCRYYNVDRKAPGWLQRGCCPNPFSLGLKRFLINLRLAPGD